MSQEENGQAKTVKCSKIPSDEYLADVASKCFEVNEGIKASLIPPMQTCVKKCSDLQNDKTVYFEALEHWWKQPGQFCAPWLRNEDGETFGETMKTYESLVNIIHQSAVKQ